MGIVARLFTVFAVAATIAPAQIFSLSTDATGWDIYFVTNFSQRDSGQPAVYKLFRLSGEVLTLIEQSPGDGWVGTYVYGPAAVSADGTARAVNRIINGGSCRCDFYTGYSTLIQTRYGTITFSANTALSANGRFAALFDHVGDKLPGTVRVLDLESRQLTPTGPQAAWSGRIVSDDGTVLIAREGGIRLTGPSRKIDLTPLYGMSRAELAGDSSRIVYDRDLQDEIRTIEVSTGVDRSLGAGHLPTLSRDGRTFSYLRDATRWSFQVWLGDAVSGSVHMLSHEPEGIVDQSISGDGATVIASTSTGRLLSIDTVSGVVTQRLGPVGPSGVLLTNAVPGSYNELVGTFPEGFVPDVRVGAIPAIILGPSPRGIAIQIPWEAQIGATIPIVQGAVEPLWDILAGRGVFAVAGAALPVGAAGPGGPAYYALHDNWSGPVKSSEPARRGEVIHLYGTGYGPVDGSVPSGKTTPSDRLYRMTSPCVWKAIGGDTNHPSRPFDALFAGLAPGLTGLYQFDFSIPLDWPYTVFNAFCEFTPGTFLPTAAIQVQQP